ncbi:hypothetical protein PV11_10097 [Exophiala sideris]|uniref:F-box domain-containing protein n=1 Tax=Exophiala sideris TaxID=1016849 RepID=A0A0D1VQM7_9EURO|nr:hypothetical protein PV11_10097 [Exophiala sideris]
MAQAPPRRFYLLTSPRTASNLVIRILNLPNQPSLLQDTKYEYFFGPVLGWKFQHHTIGKHVDELSEEEKNELKHSYQVCFDALSIQVDTAAPQRKNMFVKEHVGWLTDPVAETKFVFGEHSTCEQPWTIQTSYASTHTALNETILPDEYLKTWLPTFLIRHPALTFPSIYRTTIDNEGQQAARDDPAHVLEMTMHWSRTLYDWYIQQEYLSQFNAENGAHWPVVLDADDVILNPQVMIRYSKVIDLDSSLLNFAWEAASSEELEQISKIERRMRSTISASTGILKEKASAGLSIGTEMSKWETEFGKEEAEKLASWVRLDYTDKAPDLHKPDSTTPNAASILGLPTELIHIIVDHLHPVDRVCLALTCKSLASAVLSAPRLCPTTWSRFNDQRYSWLLPESYSLILRLAHGWIPKDKLRYCWKCHKILPRKAEYFRKRLVYKKNPKWDAKLQIPKSTWEHMSKRDRYKHLIEMWCGSPLEDSSSVYCDFCREKNPAAPLIYPVVCPVCMEQELTFLWKIPRKPWFRKMLGKIFVFILKTIGVVIGLVIGVLVWIIRTVFTQGRKGWKAICS